MEPPSKALLQTLFDLKLCTPADLRRCRRQVRRLARDLPTFDSIWIDALLRSRRISPFQARLLDSDHPERLAVGPCVLVDQLGRGEASVTYLARRRAGRDLCVLKLLQTSPESGAAMLASLTAHVGRLEKFAHPSLVAPHACLRHGHHVVAVSRYVPGPHLGELLLRRGRVPAPVVWAVARQLIDALAALEERGGVHGDIRLWNVRLTEGGVATLVDAGISPAVRPELTIHAGLPPEHYDGVAPELIGTGQPPSSASDLYALGCLLWHLLAGRPPFPTGDPLAKLVAHQLQRISDVREVAPDTPAALADLICRLTATNPAERPGTFRELRTEVGPPRRSSRRRLAGFRAMFRSAVRRAPQSAAPGPTPKWPAVLGLLVLLSTATILLLDSGARNYAANIFSAGSQSVRAEAVGDEHTDGRAREGQTGSAAMHRLPAPDATGTITLTADGPYEWRRIDAVGPLTIQAGNGARPVVLVNEPCHVVAEDVAIRNIQFRPKSAAAPKRAVLLVQAQNLTIEGCAFENGDGASEAGGIEQSIAVGWRAIDPRDRSGGWLVVRNSVFGTGTALFCSTAPRRFECDNSLKLGAGPLLALPEIPPASQVEVQLGHVTLRRATALLQWPQAEARPVGIAIEASNCVFDLDGPQAALFQLVSASEPAEWAGSLEMSGGGSLARPGLVVAAWLPPGRDAAQPLDTSDLRLEGIAAAPFEFAGPISGGPSNSVVASFLAPSRSPRPPGIDADAFAGWHE